MQTMQAVSEQDTPGWPRPPGRETLWERETTERQKEEKNRQKAGTTSRGVREFYKL